MRVEPPARVGRDFRSKHRRRILFASARVMEEQRIETIAVMARDAGKTEAEADPEVSEGDRLRSLLRDVGVRPQRLHAARHRRRRAAVELSRTRSRPGACCAALAAGNAVILKPAPETVATAWQLVQQLWAGGVPRDVLQFVPTRDDDNGRHLITHARRGRRDLDRLVRHRALFTSWRPDITLLAETSGKNAIVITACADIDVAVKDLVQSAFGHAGQKCSAASLAIVVRDVYDDPAFLRQLADAVRSLRVGPSWELSTSRRTDHPQGRAGAGTRPPPSGSGRELAHRAASTRRSRTAVASGREARRAFRIVESLNTNGSAPCWASWSPRTSPPRSSGRTGPTSASRPVSSPSTKPSANSGWTGSRPGNLYVNRGITGAIVNRQPFGGWRRSSVGPTAKAGGHHYVNSLRRWGPLTECRFGHRAWRAWWRSTGAQSIDHAGLSVEKNFQRYRHHLKVDLRSSGRHLRRVTARPHRHDRARRGRERRLTAPTKR